MDEDLLEKSEQEIVDLLNAEKEYLKTTRIQNKNIKSVSLLQKCKFCYETVEGTRRRFKFVENYEYGMGTYSICSKVLYIKDNKRS